MLNCSIKEIINFQSFVITKSTKLEPIIKKKKKKTPPKRQKLAGPTTTRSGKSHWVSIDAVSIYFTLHVNSSLGVVPKPYKNPINSVLINRAQK